MLLFKEGGGCWTDQKKLLLLLLLLLKLKEREGRERGFLIDPEEESNLVVRDGLIDLE